MSIGLYRPGQQGSRRRVIRVCLVCAIVRTENLDQGVTADDSRDCRRSIVVHDHEARPVVALDWLRRVTATGTA